MLEFICLFFPPFLGVALIERLLKKNYCRKTFLFLYAWVCLSSNFMIFLLKKFWFQTSAASFTNITVDAAFHYVPLALLASALMAFFTALFFRKMELSLELKKKDVQKPAEEPVEESTGENVEKIDG